MCCLQKSIHKQLVMKVDLVLVEASTVTGIPYGQYIQGLLQWSGKCYWVHNGWLWGMRLSDVRLLIVLDTILHCNQHYVDNVI